MVFDKYDASIIKDKKNFDTYSSSANVVSYVNYLDSISEGDIVLVA